MTDQTTDQKKNTSEGDAGSNEASVLESLEKAAEAVGVVVRYDKLAEGDVKATSGTCKIRGVDTIIIDRRLGTRERIAALARELRSFDLENVYLPPAARNLVDPQNAEAGGKQE